MNVIIEENLFNTDYIKRHTEGFDKLKKHLKMLSKIYKTILKSLKSSYKN